MPQRNYDANVRQEAASWVVRLDASDMSAQERASLEAWLDEDPRHRDALNRTHATWRELDLISPAERSTAGEHRTHRRLRHADARAAERPRRRLRALVGATTAAILVVLGMWQYPRIDLVLRADAHTGVGETRQLALVGGGTAQLDTGSAVRCNDSAQWRDVRVLAGTVSFAVGHNDPRPFRVRAGNITVTDVGTTFQLRHDADLTQVVVASGMVEVATKAGKAYVRAGEIATVADDGQAPKVTTVDADAAMAWTRGRLVFVDRPLGEVVAELNRYYDGHIVLLGDHAAARRVSGVFRTNEPLAALRAIESSLGLHAHHLGLGLVVLGA
jgi:transmembrane sensor